MRPHTARDVWYLVDADVATSNSYSAKHTEKSWRTQMQPRIMNTKEKKQIKSTKAKENQNKTS